MTSAFSPAEMACHAPTCAAVGRAKTSRNQVAVAGEKTSNGSAGTLSILLSRTDTSLARRTSSITARVYRVGRPDRGSRYVQAQWRL